MTKSFNPDRATRKLFDQFCEFPANLLAHADSEGGILDLITLITGSVAPSFFESLPTSDNTISGLGSWGDYIDDLVAQTTYTNTGETLAANPFGVDNIDILRAMQAGMSRQAQYLASETVLIEAIRDYATDPIGKVMRSSI